MELHANKDFNDETVKNQGKKIKKISSDVDIMRSRIWNEIVDTRNRLRRELKSNRVDKQRISGVFKKIRDSIINNLKDFKKRHSEEELSRLINELADRAETLHTDHALLYDLENEWDEDDLKKLANLLDDGWNDLKRVFNYR